MKAATTSNPKTQQEKEIFFKDIFRPEENRLTWKQIQKTWRTQEAQQKTREA